MDKLQMQSKNLVDENIKFIAKRFPNCVTEALDEEGKLTKLVDFDLLKQELSKDIVEGNDERYTLNWAGKKQSILTANSPINATLRPCKEESVDFDSTKNLYIEGDNLDVLKLLRETYLNKVKMIYIDPPYNTGNDFVYEDNFASSTEDYLQTSKSYDDQGNRMFQNSDSNGRFHSDWLSMMYSRLRLAKDLLTEDGVIFISIDDNEQDNLKKICNEIFGESNLVNYFVWNCSTAGGIRPKFASKTHEYILCYAKNISDLSMFFAPLSQEAIKMYNQKDEKGLYRDKDFLFRNKSTNVNQKYEITCPDGEIVHPKDGYIYRFIKSKYEEALKDGLVTFKKTKAGPLLNENNEQAGWNIYIKKYLGDATGAPSTLIPKDIVSIYNVGTQCVQDLFDNARVFENVKPIDVINYFVQMATDKDSIIMDFFSGSASTAHAVMKLNAEDGGNRKFIMVQLPELCDERSEAYKAGYKNICEIGKERIRRAGKKIKEDRNVKIDVDKNKLMQRNILEDGSFDDKYDLKIEKPNEDNLDKLDIGFRCLKLDSSCMKDIYYSPNKTTQDLLTQFEDNIKEDRTPEDLLFQVMLDMGVMLSSEIKILEINGKKVFNVNDGDLVCCFDKNINDDVVTAIAKMQPLYAVFRDASMSTDSVAVNFDQIFETYSQTTTRKII